MILSLLDAGLVRPDSLPLGLDLGDDYRLVSGDGVASDVFFALGPPIRGNLWKTTACRTSASNGRRLPVISPRWRVAPTQGGLP